MSRSTVIRSLSAAWMLLLPLAVIGTPVATAPSQHYQVATQPVTQSLGEIDMAQLREQFPIESGQPLIFATPQAVEVGLAQGQWQALPDKRALWRLRLEGPSALSLNAVFSRLALPPSAQLFLIDHIGNAVGPAIETNDVPASLRLFSAVVPGPSLTLELIVDADQRKQVSLQIERVNQGFRAIQGNRLLNHRLFDTDASLQAGGCNIDISCPEADEWQDVAASVARYTINGTGLCTGQMIAATDGVDIPYFLTANHCFSSDSAAQSLVFYFNYRSNECRTPTTGSRPGLPVNRNSDIHYGGSTLVATNSRSDFTLVQLNETPDSALDLFFTGWDRRDQNHSGGVHAIHHPSGDEKRYSYTALTAHRSNYGIDAETASGTHLRVPSWQLGTTERGSSGSGLWNSEQRLIGQLHGGIAACGNTDPDWYGRMAVSWDGPNPEARLRDWLDPAGTQAEAIDGRTACVQPEITIERSAAIASSGELVTFSAEISGGAGGPYLVEWDTDGDGINELTGESIALRFDRAGAHGLAATVYDVEQCSAQIAFTQTIEGPALGVFSAGEAQRIDANSSDAQPGSRWRLPVRVENTGNVVLERGALAFTNQSSPAGDEAYTVLNASNDACGYDWVAAGSGATNLTLTAAAGFSDASDEGLSGAINLRANTRIFSDSVDTLYLSSNGYLTPDANEQGDDYTNDCPLPSAPNTGAASLRLLPYHDDLVTNEAWTQSFASCPRPASHGATDQGCTVITWQEVEFFNSTAPAFSMQAIVYEDSGQVHYQYQASSASRGGSASIGLQNAAASEAAAYSCNQTSLSEGNNAVCLLPASAGEAVLQLETPSVALPESLAPGEAVVVDVEFGIREDAGCGTGFNLYAGAWAGVSAQGTSNTSALFSGSVPDNCQRTSTTPPDSVTPRAGLWWNPARSGNGMDLYQVPGGNQLVVIWYTANAQRQPVWYLAQGPMENGRLEADLRRFSWNGSAASDETVGTLRLDFLDSNNGLFQWQLGDEQGSERVEAFLFGIGPGSEDNTGLWYDPAESGWGLTFNNQTTAAGSDVETAVVYFYDADGAPAWMLGQREINDAQTPMQQYRVACPQCPWSASTSAAAGTLDRDFSSRTEGNVRVDLQLQTPQQGRWLRDTNILRLTEPLEP